MTAKYIKKKMKNRIKTFKAAERALVHRFWQGVKRMPAKELSVFLIQNAFEGFGRGFAQEMKKGWK